MRKVVKAKVKVKSVEKRLLALENAVKTLAPELRATHGALVRMKDAVDGFFAKDRDLGENMYSLSIIERLVAAIDKMTVAADRVIRGDVQNIPEPHQTDKKKRVRR